MLPSKESVIPSIELIFEWHMVFEHGKMAETFMYRLHYCTES